MSRKMVTVTSIPPKHVHARCAMVTKTLNVNVHPTRQSIPYRASTSGLHMCWSVRNEQGKQTQLFIVLWVGDIQTFVKLVSQFCPRFAQKRKVYAGEYGLIKKEMSNYFKNSRWQLCSLCSVQLQTITVHIILCFLALKSESYFCH